MFNAPVELPDVGALRLLQLTAPAGVLVLQTPPSFPTQSLLPSPAIAKAWVSTWGIAPPANVTSAQDAVVVPFVVRMIGFPPPPPAYTTAGFAGSTDNGMS